MNVVVVESPAKAKTINKYLGADYTVLASYGHIRDLPAKDGSVRPDEEFAMDWELDVKSSKHVKAIMAALKGADKLFLATDPDREGEAISWHVQEVLAQKKLLKGIEVKRVVFNEITKSAVLDAMANPRDLDHQLIDAYMARRALDYLVGFNLSPILWRKLPGSRSAGRVQSVALRLICEREAEIEVFKSQEYWSVEADFTTPSGGTVTAQLSQLDGRKLDKMDLRDAQAAEAAVRAIQSGSYTVTSVERKQGRRNPPPPFTTSTLQQEASRKLGFGAKRTMQVAQRLYEGVDIGGETVGLITYMRTDAVNLANEAIAAIRAQIGRAFGDSYLPAEPRLYKTKAKNAQEAHEAVRPTDVSRTPKDVAGHLSDEQLRLYELIWKRSMACQMSSAVLDQVGADIADERGKTVLRATGSVVAFDGFLKLYVEGRDDVGDDEGEKRLPQVAEGEAMALQETKPEQHFTQPPPRYTEASLVKKMEELGIGRPSTYASIITVLQDRDYVKLEKKRFLPEDRGRLVTSFLSEFFTRYVAYDFTAELEEKLDDVSGGRIAWRTVLHDFWDSFSKKIGETTELRVKDVLDALDAALGPHFFPAPEDGSDPRACPKCDDGRLNLKLGKYGAFIGCSNYPDCKFTKRLEVGNGENGESNGNLETRELGQDPETGLTVTLRQGPYGLYVQLGEAEGKGKTATKPKRASLPRGLAADEVDLAKALGLLALPRAIGTHPETGDAISAGLGRFGPYIKMGGTYVSLKEDDVLSVGMNRAVELLANAPRKDPPKELGKHPKDGKLITQRAGRWGPYVQHGRTMATIPKELRDTEITLEQAVALIAAKSGKSAPDKKEPAKKATAKKPAAKKSPAKKAAAKKPAAKKKPAASQSR
ncbi:type I DNA topoisomerase [Magnetospira thiophila]